ncbi:MAG: hypothetical protein JWO05_331 [Gemmatimonadetes bacterium]|nr:hypothetical protein [Gemmatimonadota bacterium]
MRTMRPGVAPLMAAVMAAMLSSSAVQAQDASLRDTVTRASELPYTGTIYHGAGLVSIPVAWIAPRSGTMWVTTAAKFLPSFPDQSRPNFATNVNTNLSLDTHWFGRVSLGVSAYSQNPEIGFYGNALLLKQGKNGFWPSLSVGMRNVGQRSHEDRFFIGEDIQLQGKTYTRVVPERYTNFHTSNTVFGVGTYEFGLGSRERVSFSLGGGNGLFYDDGGLGVRYNKRGTIVRGMFGGFRFVTSLREEMSLSLLAENDGFDFNAGAVYDWRGLQIGVHGTELEEGNGRGAEGYFVYNYTKLGVSIGYNGNLIDIAKGFITRTRLAELERERMLLRREIAERNRKIRGLEVALGKAEDADLEALNARRKSIETNINAEKDAMKRAQDRLREIGGGTTPPPTTPPPAER